MNLFWTIVLVLVFLVIPAILVWRAGVSHVLRDRLESILRGVTLLGIGDGLFDKNKPYTWMIQWVKWGAIPMAIMILLPTPIIWDAIFGLVLAVAIYIALGFFTKKFPTTKKIEG